jgi:hypothetical protein
MLVLVGSSAGAQSIPGAVLAKREPHHHLVYEDSSLRVLRVRVPAHDTTLLHEHDPDYFWIALGASTFVNAKLGAPDATVTSRDLGIHYTPGKFAHVARNPGNAPFDNITVELLRPQTNVRNLCEAAIADKPLDCATSVKSELAGVTEHPAFATNQTRVSLVTVAPGATIHRETNAGQTWLIALDSADAGRGLVIKGTGRWIGGTFRAPRGNGWSVANSGRAPIRAIAVIAP